MPQRRTNERVLRQWTSQVNNAFATTLRQAQCRRSGTKWGRWEWWVERSNEVREWVLIMNTDLWCGYLRRRSELDEGPEERRGKKDASSDEQTDWRGKRMEWMKGGLSLSDPREEERWEAEPRMNDRTMRKWAEGPWRDKTNEVSLRVYGRWRALGKEIRGMPRKSMVPGRSASGPNLGAGDHRVKIHVSTREQLRPH